MKKAHSDKLKYVPRIGKTGALQCPCCENYTIVPDEEVIVDICPVCYWQYDIVAQEHPAISIGPNKVSLIQSRENYQRYGACEKRFAKNKVVRQPFSGELPENN